MFGLFDNIAGVCDAGMDYQRQTACRSTMLKETSTRSLFGMCMPTVFVTVCFGSCHYLLLLNKFAESSV